MNSRKRRHQSLSPSADPPRQHRGRRVYRQHDHHGSGNRHNNNNNRNGRDNSQSSFDDASREHRIPDYVYEPHRSTRQASDRDRAHHQRGRDRDRGYHRHPRHNPMPPPAPRQLRANEGNTASEDGHTKTIPQANRDKCGACSQDHDIRYCPYPNTNDGRTKICPICNTSNHAWFECPHYKRDITEQWNVCWANRRCLPTLVHDAPLDEILHSRVSLARETRNEDEPSPLENFNNLPGPLSPAFVKKLMPIDRGDSHIAQEVRRGRIIPWVLKREALEDNEARPNNAIRDKSTMDMRFDRFITGTRSSAESVPAASKQPFFNDMAVVEESIVMSYVQILEIQPPPSLKDIQSTRTYPDVNWSRGAKRICDNCGTEGHYPWDCPILCKGCGMSKQFHTGTLGGQCRLGCMCRDEPGHTRSACNRLCRPCSIEDRGSDTELKDCKKHCPSHLGLIEDEQAHLRCAHDHIACPLCWGRHWHQDCPRWLGTLCLRQDCLATNCNTHCHVCGGFGADDIMSYFPQNDNAAYRQHVQRLVLTWHQYLDNTQWERIAVPDADIKHSSWSVLRCRRHTSVTADACSLEKRRVNTWRKVVDCVRGGFTEMTIPEAVRLLQTPECPTCFYQHGQD